MRGLLTAALTAGALLAIPAGAHAALNLTVTKVGASAEPGATVQYQVLVEGTSDAVVSETLAFSGSHSNYEGSPLTIGNVVEAEASANASVVGGVATIDAAFDGAVDSATFTFDVTLPDYYIANFSVSAEGSDSGFDNSPNSEVVKGDNSKTSKLYTSWSAATPSSGVVNEWVAKDGTFTSTLTVHNWGDGSAHHVALDFWAGGSHSAIQEPGLKAGSETELAYFMPEVKIAAGGDCVIEPSTNDSECAFGEIPAGGSKTVTVTVSKLDFLGATVNPSVSMSSQRHEKSRNNGVPGWNDTDNYTTGLSHATMNVTDGGTVRITSQSKGPNTWPGRTDLPLLFEFANNGANDVTGGVLSISGTIFNDKGAPTSDWNSATFDPWFEGDTGTAPIGSIKSISLSTGGTCAKKTEYTWDSTTMKYVLKTRMFQWVCTGISIPKGARITGTVVANFASGRVNSYPADSPQNGGNAEYVSVNASLDLAQYAERGSSTYASWGSSLNRAQNADLDVSVTSAKDIGAERLGLHTVTIKNNGPSKAENINLGGSTYKLVGSFEPTLLPGACAAVVTPTSLSCNAGDLESGQSMTLVIPVLGAKKLGTAQVTTYWVSNSETDANPDNNSVAHTQMVVKASLAPLQGVKIVKAPAVFKFATLGRTGLKSTVTVPGPSVVTVDLQVSRLVAQKMGLVKGGKARAKAPAFIKIGTGKKVMKAGGKATVVTKLTRAYKAKVLKLRKPLKVQRVVKVVSTAPLTKGATHLATNNMTLRK